MDGESLVREYLQSRDETMREQVVQAYLPLVRYIVNRLNIPASNTLNKNDFYQFGIIGLLDALNRYQLDYGSQFKSFAYKRIYGEIIDAVRQHGYLSRSQLALVKKVENAERHLIASLKREPSLAEVCDYLEIPEEEYYSIIQNSQLNYSIPLYNNPVGSDKERLNNINTIPDQSQPTPEEKLSSDSLKNELKAIIISLPEKQRLVLALYYYEELTLNDIGQVLGVSESRVSQILNSTLVKIRAQLKVGE